MKASSVAGRAAPGQGWLRLAVVGSLLMACGALTISGVHLQTRAHMREVLTGTEGRIRTDGQMQVLNQIMTRGLMLSIGGLGLVGVGVAASVGGLGGFFLARRRHRAPSPPPP